MANSRKDAAAGKAPSERVLVTGGAGFIGAHVTHLLWRQGYDVVVIDQKRSTEIDSLSSLIGKPRFAYVTGTLLGAHALDEALAGTSIVFHLAGTSNPMQSLDTPLDAHTANATGTLLVLEAARRNKVRKVVYASSSSVYGRVASPRTREDAPLCPCTPYAAAKVAGEAYCGMYERCYGLATVCLRLFNVYGPTREGTLPAFGVVSHFMDDALEGRPLTVFGDGTNTRDFVYVSDAAQAFVAATNASVTGPLNIAGGQPVAIDEVADMILELTGSQSSIAHAPKHGGEMPHSGADISRARACGWEPVVGIRDGLARTFNALQVARQTPAPKRTQA